MMMKKRRLYGAVAAATAVAGAMAQPDTAQARPQSPDYATMTSSTGAVGAAVARGLNSAKGYGKGQAAETWAPWLWAGAGQTDAFSAPEARGWLERGRAMFTDRNFTGALDQLRQASRSRELTAREQETLERMEALSAFGLGREGAEGMLRRWLAKYPESTDRADVMMSVGDCVFQENYADALKIYQSVDPDALRSAERADALYYRRAYCYMKLADWGRALGAFGRLRTSKEYGNAARFYTAYIDYAQGRYGEAKAGFLALNQSEEPGSMAPFYLSQIYYLEGEYDKALTTARSVLGRSVAEPYLAEANRIAGESLYQTGHADEAIPYLRKYARMAESPQISALYILGLSEYRAGDWTAAAETLRPVTADESSMGQNAYVYLGQALMKTGDTNGAIMAFDRALNMAYDADARETAFYNYAVAKYAGGTVPFGSSVETFEDFLTRYPNSRYAEDVRQYIITGYLTDNNYEAALASINRTKAPSARILAAKQQVLYTLGTRMLASGDAARAADYLRQAEKLSHHNAEIARETRLALGEALYRTGDYDGAVGQLTAFLNDSRGASAENVAVGRFDLGYAYMAKKEWGKAAESFMRMIGAPGSLDAAVRADAWNRVGDCRYYMKEWAQAAEAYDKAYALQPEAGDYALFQKAVMQGYQGNFAGKLSGLRAMTEEFPTSSLIPDAMLEMTEAQLQTDNADGAIETWKELIANYPNTAQGRQAYLQMALTLTDKGRDGEAREAYREIIRRYPTSDEAAQAAETLKRIAAANGTLDDYLAFIGSVENAPKVDTDEADRLTYYAAEQAYDDGKGTGRLEAYLAKYPGGKYRLQANALLLEAADAAGNRDKAYGYACEIITRWPDNAAAEQAYAVKAATEYGRGMGEEALASWQALEKRASTPENVNAARMGIMRVARDLGRADDLLSASDKVLQTTAIGSEEKTEAAFSRGLAMQLKGDDEAAIGAWTKLAGNTDELYGAKSAVYLAEAQLEKGNAAAAQHTAENFVNSDTPHTYWLARGFIVLSDALRKQGKKYDADEYLKALKENYPGKEADIFMMIEERMGK